MKKLLFILFTNFFTFNSLAGDLVKFGRLLVINIVDPYCLIKACQEENLEECEKLIRIGVDVNKAKRGRTPLLAALYSNKKTKITELLLNNGANVNKANNCGETPILYAIKRGWHDIVQSLLDRGANLYKSSKFDTPILEAVHRYKITKILLDKGINFNISFQNQSPLERAIYYGFIDTVELLLANGTQRNHRIKTKYHLYMQKIMDKYENLQKQAIPKGIDLPFEQRIKTINNWILENMQENKESFEYNMDFPLEICVFIFSFIPRECINLMYVSKLFYTLIYDKNMIINFIELIPLKNKIDHLINLGFEVSPAITKQVMEKFAQENNLKF